MTVQRQQQENVVGIKETRAVGMDTTSVSFNLFGAFLELNEKRLLSFQTRPKYCQVREFFIEIISCKHF